MKGPKIKEFHITPIAVVDPPLLNAAGLHAPYALRTVVELVTDDNISGISEIPGNIAIDIALEKSKSLIIGQDPFQLNQIRVEVISQGAAGSWQMVNRHKTMLADKFDFGFAVDWMRKDLGICLATANQIGASLPVTALIDQFYKDVQRLGGGRNDTSSLIRRWK